MSAPTLVFIFGHLLSPLMSVMVTCYGVCYGLMDFCLGCSNFEFLLTETFLAHRLCLLFAVQEKKAHIFMRSPFYIHCSLLNHTGSTFNIPLRPTEINISFWSPFRSISLNISQYHSISLNITQYQL